VKLQRTFHFNFALLGVIPLVNVLFLVLVYYTMGSQFTLQPGVQVDLPATSFAIGTRGTAQIVSLTAAPVPGIFHLDQKITLETLLKRLDENPAADRSLLIKADKNAPVGLRDEIVNEALRRGYTVFIAGEFLPQ
jgi:biopolymer transport protein ExbD